MNVTTRLGRYLMGSYVLNFLFILVSILAIIYLFDTVELLRRAGGKQNVPFLFVLKLGLLKLPEVGQIILPFSVLFSALYTFWSLTRRHELVIIKSAGLSIWQLLLPFIAVAIMAGTLHITIFNPLAAASLSKYEQLENEYLSHRKHFVTLLREGLWLKQEHEGGHIILHGQDVKLPEWTIKNTMVLFFDKDQNMYRRVDAKEALLDQEKGIWVFRDALSNSAIDSAEKLPMVVISTDLTKKDLEESFASPETISFWTLPHFIQTMEKTGFDTTKLKIHFQSLIAQPLLFMAMILLAAVAGLRPPREKATLELILAGLAAGFVVFFMTSFMQALGASHQIPIILAAWSPAIVTTLLGITAILNMEDG